MTMSSTQSYETMESERTPIRGKYEILVLWSIVINVERNELLY